MSLLLWKQEVKQITFTIPHPLFPQLLMLLQSTQQLSQSQGHRCHNKTWVILVLSPIKWPTCWEKALAGRKHAGYRLDHLLLQVPFVSSAKSAKVQFGWKPWSLTETQIALLLLGDLEWHFTNAPSSFCRFLSWLSARKHNDRFSCLWL